MQRLKCHLAGGARSGYGESLRSGKKGNSIFCNGTRATQTWKRSKRWSMPKKLLPSPLHILCTIYSCVRPRFMRRTRVFSIATFRGSQQHLQPQCGTKNSFALLSVRKLCCSPHVLPMALDIIGLRWREDAVIKRLKRAGMGPGIGIKSVADSRSWLPRTRAHSMSANMHSSTRFLKSTRCSSSASLESFL